MCAAVCHQKQAPAVGRTCARIIIDLVSDPDRRVMIQCIHDTADLSTFACQISPPIQPGEMATVGCVCEVGQFLGDHY